MTMSKWLQLYPLTRVAVEWSNVAERYATDAIQHKEAGSYFGVYLVDMPIICFLILVFGLLETVLLPVFPLWSRLWSGGIRNG